MSRQQSPLRTLGIHKELLVSEAEVLRTQLGQDLDLIHQGLEGWGERAKSVASYSTLAVTALAVVSKFHPAHQTGLNGKFSLLSTLLTGARAGSAIWEALHPRPR
jgi:type VI protein secretion system component VasF